MLPRQPLRFIQVDDPGAGKIVVAGMLIREMTLRADARRVLIVAPGSLTDQWQDELREKFGLDLELFSREKQEQCRSCNYFAEQDSLIARLDQLSLNEEYQQLLEQAEWDLIVVDEVQKMPANYFCNKVNETGRFNLSKFLGSLTRHYLLMTATPHNGKEDDCQLFMWLLDGDRFDGKFREGAHKMDITDMMRRMVKEELLRFDGKHYTLSYAEALLHDQVTDNVRNEMNRADRLDGKRKGSVSFPLTQLERLLASSPQAIYTSLSCRRKRLEARLDELQLEARANVLRENLGEYVVHREIDLPYDLYDAQDEHSADEYENAAYQVMGQATATETITELQTEILILQDLESAAARAGIERIAMLALFDAEHAPGHRTKDVPTDKCGWDIAAYIEQSDSLPLECHIEVKGRAKGGTITVTANEIRYGLNQKEKFVLAGVVVGGDHADSVHYVLTPFTQKPDSAEVSKNLDLGLLSQPAATLPSFCT